MYAFVLVLLASMEDVDICFKKQFCHLLEATLEEIT